MSAYIITGSAFNLYRRGTTTVSPAAAASGPADALFDDDPSTPHIAGSIVSGAFMRVRYNAISNPGFEAVGTAWTIGNSGTGAAFYHTIAPHSGTYHMILSGTDGSNLGFAQQVFNVNAGESRRLSFWPRRGAGTGSYYCSIQNTHTGNYWTGFGWSAVPTPLPFSTTTTYAKKTFDYTVESFEATRAQQSPIRITVVNASGGDLYVDDCLDLAGVTFAGIFGHNYGPVTPLVQSSDDGTTWTTQAPMTIRRPAMYVTFPVVFAEWWQIITNTPNDEEAYTGEAVLAQHQVLARGPVAPLNTEDEIMGVRGISPHGRVMVYILADEPRQSVDLSFLSTTIAEASAVAKDLFLRSMQGRFGAIVVPVDTEPAVYYGRFLDPITQSRTLPAMARCVLRLRGDPYPMVGA